MALCVNEERLTITFSNLHIAQIGKSIEIVNEFEATCTHRNEAKQLKPVSDEDERLQENSTQGEATGFLQEFGSAFKTTSLKEAEADFCTLSTPQNASLDKFHNESRMEEVLGVEYGMPLIRKQGVMTGSKCETVMKRLEKLQDYGMFEAHEKFACDLLESHPTKENPDMRATLLIERGMACFYANDLRKCKQHFNDALRMGDSLVNRELLEGRALFLKSAAYRREKKFNRALQCLQRAELLLLHHESGEDKGELYYNYGSLWLDMYSTKSSYDQGRKAFREEARKCFDSAIEHGAKDERLRVQLKKKRYYNLKIAALYLDCGTKAARKTQQFHKEDVEEARKRLDFVEYKLSDGIPIGTKVQLLLTRADQHYRQGNLRLAREVAEEGLQIAQKMETNSSIGLLRDRIEEMQAMGDVRPRNVDSVVTCIGDSGWYGDCSNSD